MSSGASLVAIGVSGARVPLSQQRHHFELCSHEARGRPGLRSQAYCEHLRQIGKFMLTPTGPEQPHTLIESIDGHGDRVLRHVTLERHAHVLEFCCGAGRLGAELAVHCATWTGCEGSVSLLNHARRMLSSHQNVVLHEISEFDLAPIGAATQDVVYASAIYFHLSKQERYRIVEEAHRVLRPAGRLYIDNLALTSEAGWALFEQARRYPAPDRPPQLGSGSTPDEFDTYLRRAGFSTWRTQVEGAWVVGVGTK